MKSGSPNGQKLRIVHVSSQLDVGGLEFLLLEFARLVDRDRVELRFVSLGARGALADEIESLGWPVTAFERPTQIRIGLVPQLAALFSECKADIVHTHNNCPLIYAAPAARLARVDGVVHTRHGQSDGVSRGQKMIFRLASRLTDQVVCVSGDVERLSRLQGVADGRVSTILNGVDSRRFAYRGPNPDGPAVLVARLAAPKDIPTLVRATLLAAAEDPGFRMDIAGDGECQVAIARLISELGLAGRVRLLGLVRDIPRLLAEASMFVLSSLSEGIPLVILEAMSVGLPVVATNVGGVPEVVVDGKTGVLTAPGVASDLAAAMLQLRRDPAKARRMGIEGRHRVEQLFDVQQMVESYDRLYRSILKRRRCS